MKTQIILSILFLSSIQIFAQRENTNYKNGIGIQIVPISIGYLKDSNFSPLNYTEKGLGFGLSYFRQKKNTFLLDIRFGFNSMTTPKVDFFSTTHLQGNLILDYHFNKNTSNEKLKYYFGPQYKFNFNFLSDNSDLAFSYFATHNFSVLGGIEYQLANRHRVASSLSLPVFALIIQPPYNGFDEALEVKSNQPLKLITDGKFLSFNKYQAFNFAFNYTYLLSKRLDLMFAYELHYQRINDLHKFILAQHQFILKTTINF